MNLNRIERDSIVLLRRNPLFEINFNRITVYFEEGFEIFNLSSTVKIPIPYPCHKILVHYASELEFGKVRAINNRSSNLGSGFVISLAKRNTLATAFSNVTRRSTFTFDLDMGGRFTPPD